MTLPVGSITGFLRMLGAAEFDAAVTGAQRSMNLAAGSALKMAGAVDKTDAALARSRSTTLTASSAAAKFRAEQLSATAATERYNAALASGNASAARLASAEASMIRANERVAASMRAKAAVTAKSQAAMVASVTSAGKKMSKAVTLPVVALAAVSVHEAAQFQKSMTLIQTAGGETEAKASAISKGVLKVAQDTGTSLDQLGKGIYTVSKAGAQKWSATEQIEVLRAAAQGAKAENVDLGTSVDALTSVMLGYNMSASQAVQAENQIIRASGLSKTSMQEFAGSLANVVPLASSLHISFAQIAGAEATMTQHGETAQRATDNLSNLITNLAGQNNVASKAMQQLGLNTVQLQKHLAQNGLTGTLQMVEDHIAKSSKGGMVVVSAFKQAQQATHDLQVELGHMDGQLKTNATAFANGSMSYKDFYAYTKSLGGQQYVLAKNFITTNMAAKGFNSQLTSGNASVRTTATELQKLLGGVTGMRTALMLGGTSATQFASNVKEIQKASLDAGADVLGWAKTQDTLSVKMDKAKASLQVMAVEIGDELIPAVSHLADEGTKAAHWVDGLSHTQKEVLAWSVGVLAAMGPVLSLGGKLATVGRGIGTFTATSAAKLAALAGASEASSLRIATAMRMTTSALTGAGVGLALGEITKNSSNATKGISALGAAATGAAIGFGVGGPLGAAIGGAVGGLSDLAVGFFHSGDAASKASKQATDAMKAERQEVENLTQAVRADNGALGDNVRANVAKSLQDSGAADLAQKLGINLSDLTNDMLGNAKAENRVSNAILKYANQNITLKNQMQSPSAGLETKIKAAQKLAGLINNEGNAVDSATKKYQQYAELLGGATAAQAKMQSTIRATLKTLGIEQLYLADLGRTKATPKVSAEIRDLQAKLKSAKSQLSNLAAEKPTPKVSAKIDGLVSVIDAAQKKIDSLYQVHEPTVNVDTKQALANVRAIQDALNGLHGVSVAGTVAATTQGGIGGHHASGGTVRGPGSGTSDSVPIMASTGEEIINAKQSAKHRGLLKAINAGVDGFATGGTVGGDLSSLTSALGIGTSSSPVSAVKQAIAQLLSDAGAGSELAGAINAEGAALLGYTRTRTDIVNELNKSEQRMKTLIQDAHSVAASVRSAVNGTFDIGTAGGGLNGQSPISARSILAQEKAANANAKRFDRGLHKLEKEGLGQSLIGQLGQEGPAALPTVLALLKANPHQLHAINHNAAGLHQTGRDLGVFVSNDMFGSRIDAAKGVVTELKSQKKAIEKQTEALVKRLDDIDKRLATAPRLTGVEVGRNMPKPSAPSHGGPDATRRAAATLGAR